MYIAFIHELTSIIQVAMGRLLRFMDEISISEIPFSKSDSAIQKQLTGMYLNLTAYCKTNNINPQAVITPPTTPPQAPVVVSSVPAPPPAPPPVPPPMPPPMPAINKENVQSSFKAPLAKRELIASSSSPSQKSKSPLTIRDELLNHIQQSGRKTLRPTTAMRSPVSVYAVVRLYCDGSYPYLSHREARRRESIESTSRATPQTSLLVCTLDLICTYFTINSIY